jgi:hypothetical protein
MPLIAHFHAEMKIQLLALITAAAMSVITHAKAALLTRVIINTMCIQTITTQLMRNYLIIHLVNVNMEF